jgi:hypothetical protein
MLIAKTPDKGGAALFELHHWVVDSAVRSEAWVGVTAAQKI